MKKRPKKMPKKMTARERRNFLGIPEPRQIRAELRRAVLRDVPHEKRQEALDKVRAGGTLGGIAQSCGITVMQLCSIIDMNTVTHTFKTLREVAL